MMATAKVQDTQRPPSAVAQEHLHAYSVQYPGHPLLIVHVFNCVRITTSLTAKIVQQAVSVGS